MRFLSVCSGIEAASVAWAPLGWKASAFSEIEPFPCAVLAHHYPDVPNLGDMTKFKDWPDDLSIDLLCGGTPCQSFSVAGLRAGLADPRGNLMLTYLAIAAKYRPKWVVWENVPGVLSSWSGDEPPSDLEEGQEWEAVETSDFGSFLAGLGQLGYGFAYRVLDAQYFGVPQRRRRVFVVGCLGDWRAAAAVLFERHSLQGHPAPRREPAEDAAATLAGGARKRGGFSYDDVPAVAFGGNNTRGPIEVATALNACASASGRMDFESETFIAQPGIAYVPEIAATMVARSSRGGGQTNSPGHQADHELIALDLRNGTQSDVAQTIQAAGLGTERGGNPNAIPHVLAFDCKASGHSGFGFGEVAGTQRARGHADSHTNGGGHQAVAFQSSQSGVRIDDVHATLDSNNGPRRHNGALLGMQVRRLTPRECERLQGFPDNYTLVQHGLRIRPEKLEADWVKYLARGNPKGLTREEAAGMAADGPRYKALGNSWAVPCARWIGSRITAVDAITASLRRAA